MRKVISCIVALLVCVSLAMPAFAAVGTFVPSISFKDGPEIVSATLDGESVDGCVIVTTISEAREKTTDITQDERDLLLEVYEGLNDGSVTPPELPEGYVIRDLVDASFEYTDCRTLEDHNHKDRRLEEKGVTLTVAFKLGVGKNVNVVVMTYIDGVWTEIESVTNNGDGTVTCVFEDICPVAFAVKQEGQNAVPSLGDTFGRYLPLWIGILVASAVALVAVVVIARKKKH